MLDAERLAHWYFRLNGFLTIPNFVVHPDRGYGIKTDIDILGVRFPHRCELLENPMQDDEVFTKVAGRPFIAIAEVKSGEATINPAWRMPEKMNVQRFLRLIGAFHPDDVPRIAKIFYQSGGYDDERFHVSWIAVGERLNEEIRTKYPKLLHIPWHQISTFIFDRFDSYARQKKDSRQWDEAGRALLDLFWKHRAKPAEFAAALRKTFGIVPIAG